jgi:hypothetical protein
MGLGAEEVDEHDIHAGVNAEGFVEQKGHENA